jgi:phosphoglycolate phosphatase
VRVCDGGGAIRVATPWARFGEKMRKLYAIIFDLDGTLVDSSPAIIECINYALARRGLPPAEPQVVERGIGTPLEAMFASLAGVTDSAELVRLYREQFTRVFLPKSHLFPGVKQSLQTARNRGYRLAVATTKPRYYAEPILEHLGVRSLFEAVTGAEEVSRLKPSPDILHLALGRLGSTNEETLYVGDHPVDVAAAKAAGIEVICVTTGFWRRAELERLRPAAVVETLAELLTLLPDRAGGCLPSSSPLLR